MEKWRDIPGYEGSYQVSNFGNVRTCEGKVTYTERHGVRHWKQRVLRQKIFRGKRGRKDARVSLWINGCEKTWLVARLVGLAWCDGFYPEMTINHINGNTLDNRAENLEWVSNAVNIQKGFSSGLYANTQKPVLLREGINTFRFASMAEASRFCGRSIHYVSQCFHRHKQASAVDGHFYNIEVVETEQNQQQAERCKV